MRISKIFVPYGVTKSTNLEEINLTKKSLGSTVALVGKNGAGKSRVLKFVENYLESVTTENLCLGHISNIPSLVVGSYQTNINAAASLMSQLENPELLDSQKIQLKAQATQQISGLAQNLQRMGKSYIKVVDNDDLKNIKAAVANSNSLTFKQILENRHFNLGQIQQANRPALHLNEFSEFNTQSTIQYFTQLTNDIVAEEFNLYVKNRTNPERIGPEIAKNISFKLFSIFQDYVKKFLGKEFSYQQTAQGNTVTSVLHYNDKPFNLKQFSPGQKTLFAYAILFFYLDANSQTNIRESIIIIDEPEKHLHPEAQINLISALKSIIKKSGQLWIATHSVHILSHLEYDEIMMVQDNLIVPPSRTTPGKSFNELMGIDDHISKLLNFIGSISDWAYANFMAQCFKSPEVVFCNDPNDPQFKLFKRFISKKAGINLLDYGAGKGRIGYTLSDDYEISKKVLYSAFEPDKRNFELLGSVPRIKKVYSNASEIPENSFDCVLLCNVLHEIMPTEWSVVLFNIKRILNEDGYLLIVEDRFLPKGETAHQFGYLILGTEETKILLNTETATTLELDEKQYKERIIFNAFLKKEINPGTESVINAIKKLKENSFNNLKLLRKTDQDINSGRRYANETQLYINSQLALEALEETAGNRR